jgi:hypothetical protein
LVVGRLATQIKRGTRDAEKRIKIIVSSGENVKGLIA